MNTMLLRHAPELIAAHMRATAGRRHPDQAGPFCTGFDPHSNDPFRNYAVPADGVRPTPDEAYEIPQPPGLRDVERLASVVQRGGVVSVAVDGASGQIAGTGLVDVVGPGTSTGELAAIGVRAAFRRRGIASALSAHLARTAHSQAIPLVFLEAEPGEERI